MVEYSTAQTVRELREQQDAIARAGLLGLRETSRERVFQEIVVLTRDALHGHFSKIALSQADGGLLLCAGVGWPEGVVGHLETPSGRESQEHYTMRIRAPVVVDDLPNERRFKPNPALLELGIVSGVSTIIQGAHLTYGVLQVDSRSPRAFSEDQVGFLQSAANILGGFLDRETREQERETFFSAVAHEVRGPLTAVLGFSQRLVRRLAVGSVIDARTLEEIHAVEQGGRSMQRTINMLSDLLEVTTPRARTRAEITLATLLGTVVDEMNEEFPEITFEQDLPSADIEVRGDDRAARIALRNLLENAAKYSIREPVVRIQVVQEDGEVEVRINDNCGGLEGDELTRMFEAYYRGESPRSPQGLGLGLYLTERICSRFGWSIQVHNHRGEGCEFRLIMPREHQPAT